MLEGYKVRETLGKLIVDCWMTYGELRWGKDIRGVVT